MTLEENLATIAEQSIKQTRLLEQLLKRDAGTEASASEIKQESPSIKKTETKDGVSIEEVRAAFSKVSELCGREEAVKILESFNATKLPELAKEKYTEAKKACDLALEGKK